MDLLGCVVNSMCEDLPMTAPRICHQSLVRHEGCIHFQCLSDITPQVERSIYICTVWFGNFREGFIFTFLLVKSYLRKLELQIFSALMHLQANDVSVRPSSNIHMHVYSSMRLRHIAFQRFPMPHKHQCMPNRDIRTASNTSAQPMTTLIISRR